MTIREALKNETGALPEDVIYAVHDLETDDTAYLASIPGMMRSIEEGIDTPLSECVPISDVWTHYE